MAYRIDYGATGTHRKIVRRRLTTPTIKAAILVLALVVCALIVKIFGLTWVQEVLLPGDPEVTAAALQNMTDGLRNGDSLWEAVTTFCQEIVANGQ